MARVKSAIATRKKHKKVLKQAKAYVGRKDKKSDFRRLWITRINAAARMNGTTYSKLMAGLKKNNIAINRKMLAELAVNDSAAFTALVKQANA